MQFSSLSRISFHNGNNFVIYFDSRSALQALESLYTRNPLALKIQCSLCNLAPVGLSGNEKADLLTKRAKLLPLANHNALPLQDYVPSIRLCLLVVPLGPVFVDDNKLA